MKEIANGLVITYTTKDTNREYKKSELTQIREGTFPLEKIQSLLGAAGEIRKWHIRNGKRYFGNYLEADWQKFLEDIQKNGIKEPIMIYVEKDGGIYIGEGNHRIQAAIQLSISKVPIDIRYFGNSQKYITYFD